MVGIGTAIATGAIFGIFVGLFLAVVISSIKSWRDKRKAFKNNPDILEQIKSNKEVKYGTGKKERSSGGEQRGESDGLAGDSERESDIKESVEHTPDKSSSDERRRVSVSNPSFTLRD